ncbi:MAG TPA: SCO family protein [Solirubrobacterales bacterium]|jgi:protein SCO1/2
MRLAVFVLCLPAVGIVGTAVSGCGGSSAGATTARFIGGDAVPAKPAAPIRLTDYRGHEVELAALKGKPVLVAFLYTHCTDLCPVVAAKVHTAYSLLGAHEVHPVFLAVSVDPANDTAASATRFNREHRTTGEIDWLLGSHAELARVWRAWRIVPEREPNDPEVIEHSADIYGVGADGEVHVLYSPDFKPALLARDIQALAAD